MVDAVGPGRKTKGRNVVHTDRMTHGERRRMRIFEKVDPAVRDQRAFESALKAMIGQRNENAERLRAAKAKLDNRRTTCARKRRGCARSRAAGPSRRRGQARALNGAAAKIGKMAKAVAADEEGDDEDDEREPPPPPGAPWPWVWVLGGLLGLSVLVNRILLVRR